MLFNTNDYQLLFTFKLKPNKLSLKSRVSGPESSGSGDTRIRSHLRIIKKRNKTVPHKDTKTSRRKGYLLYIRRATNGKTLQIKAEVLHAHNLTHTPCQTDRISAPNTPAEGIYTHNRDIGVCAVTAVMSHVAQHNLQHKPFTDWTHTHAEPYLTAGSPW